MKKKMFCIFLIIVIMFCLGTFLSACGSNNTAKIEKIDNASINGNEIFMYVSYDTNEVPLADKVKCNKNSIWKLYYDNMGQTEIPTKIATGKYGELQAGNNTFYIVVNSQNGSITNTYQLTIHRSYAIQVLYHDGNSLLKRELAYTGAEYVVDYSPNLTEYTFNGWKTNNGENIISFIPWGETHLYIDKTPKVFTATLNTNGGDGIDTNTISLNYGEITTLPVPTRTGYNFLGWYIDDVALTDSDGKTFSNWSVCISNVITAHWEIIKFNIETKVNDSKAGAVCGNGLYNYSEEVTLKATTNIGYNFIGWYDEHNNLITVDEEFVFYALDNESYTAKWCFYTLTTNINYPNAGEITSYTEKKISIGQTVNLSAIDNNNIGYIWKGWYKDSELITTNLNLAIEMSSADLQYTAVWDVYLELQNFAFVSTQTECEISSIIDKTVTEIEIPPYVTSIANGALNGCSNLTQLTIPFVGGNNKEKTASPITLFGYIFGTNEYVGSKKIVQKYSNSVFNTSPQIYYLPQNLKSVIVDSGAIYYGAFSGCSMITSIILENDITCIEEATFNGCENLQQITIPFVGKTRGVNYSRESLFGYIFGDNQYANAISTTQQYGGTSDKAVTYFIPQSLSKVIIGSAVSIPNYAFSHCTAIKEILIPETVEQIGDRAFEYTTGLETVYWNSTNCDDTNFSNPIFMGSKVKTIILGDNVESIPNCAFVECMSLTEVSISANSKLKSIGIDAFTYCYSLAEIYLPKSITTIKYRAFYFTGLSSVKYAGNEIEWADIEIGNDNGSLLRATITYNSII